ncbi:ATP-binding protein [Streptomyces sp. RGM 3693]|uniref:ATP-binding protein n=1 Tax=Streptomyces sp. RGM 3693 TaxID=3413284 RepID=UPI003D286247
MYRSREWIFERIRRDRRLDPMVSQRTLAQRYRVSCKTVVKTLNHPVPTVRKPPLGSLDLDTKGAKLLFQIFTEREERKATAVATNSPFNEWEAINEPRLCAAIADRITFRCTFIQTGTESHRLQATEAEHHTAR